MIQCANPLAQYEAHRSDIDSAIRRVLESGRYVLGEQVAAFESEFAAYVGARHAVGVGNGTEALHLALKACNLGRGDEVITVSHTAVATIVAVELVGATPVLVDIDPETFTLDVNRLEQVVLSRSGRVKAILPVHLYGRPAELDVVMYVAERHGLRVIEDCAQAHGARYRGRLVGSYGHLSCFSFYPTKNLGAVGDGGAVVTSDPELADRVRLLRQYGWTEQRTSLVCGVNSRLDEIQAAILRAKLPYLDGDNAARVRIARRYSEALSDLPIDLPVSRPHATHAFNLFVIRSGERDALQSHLERHGIAGGIHYPVPVHLQPAYQSRFPGADDLPCSERAAREVLSLPMYPELTDGAVDQIVGAIRSFPFGRPQ